MTDARLERIQRFLACARVLTDRNHALRREAERTLPLVTGLCAQNVAWALDNALEVNASELELARLCARTPASERAHVLLSANVFVAALRAIAIGLACAPRVFVRPSRREPEMVRLLAQAAPGQFEIVDTLEPAAGDHCWAYGSDETLAELRRALPDGVTLHGHGSGYGVVLLESRELDTAASLREISRSLAIDIAAFDQRGCLSPRIVLVQGESGTGAQLGYALAEAMADRERQIPIGKLTSAERAEVRRYRDTLCMTGRVVSAGQGWVSFEDHSLPWCLPPIGRVVHVRTVTDAIGEIREHAQAITTIGVCDSNSRLATRLAHEFPTARIARIGFLQRPPLDGPVDLRNADR